MKVVLLRDLSTAFQKPDINTVKGVLLVFDKGIITTFKVKENLLYLLEEGTYILHYEYSPKFDKKLWEFYGTGTRSEIKFHIGQDSTHSRGCILLRSNDDIRLRNTLDSTKVYEINVQNI